VALVGASLPFWPVGAFFGFAPLPLGFFGVIAILVVIYIVLVDATKTWFFRAAASRSTTGADRRPHAHRRAARMLAR
jgi:Mg2+-importing ATPase